MTTNKANGLDEILDAYGGVAYPKPINKRQAKQAINAYILEIIGEDFTQQERHWSDERADWCGRGGTMIDTRCICDQLNALKAEQRNKLTQPKGE